VNGRGRSRLLLGGRTTLAPWGLAAVATLLAACSSPSVPPDADLVLLHGTVWSGLAERPLPDAAVVVGDGRIVAVGPVGEGEIPDGVPTIDLAGGFVLPGLIDNHVHVLDRLHEDPATTRDGLRRWLCAGVRSPAVAGRPADPSRLGSPPIRAVMKYTEIYIAGLLGWL